MQTPSCKAQSKACGSHDPQALYLDYFDIYELEGRYFAFIKLNVNWQDPCYLYEYDAGSDKLKELTVWQDVDLVGLHLIENGISK